MKEIHIVGKINREIFKVVTSDIRTDEVIITAERIQHIKDNHPGDYEKFKDFIGNSLQNPEYIFASDEPNTALIVDSIKLNCESFAVVVKIKVSTDPKEYKNSILTLMSLSERKRKKYIRNKKILYKRE